MCNACQHHRCKCEEELLELTLHALAAGLVTGCGLGFYVEMGQALHQTAASPNHQNSSRGPLSSLRAANVRLDLHSSFPIWAALSALVCFLGACFARRQCHKETARALANTLFLAPVLFQLGAFTTCKGWRL